VISTTIDVSAAEFARRTGWEIKPEGACKEGRCVPLPEVVTDSVHLPYIAKLLKMPLVHDEAAALWCLGPASGGKALSSALAPELELPDWRGETFRLSSLRGSKVLMVAWASW
jgi:hypothetical protein